MTRWLGFSSNRGKEPLGIVTFILAAIFLFTLIVFTMNWQSLTRNSTMFLVSYLNLTTLRPPSTYRDTGMTSIRPG